MINGFLFKNVDNIPGHIGHISDWPVLNSSLALMYRINRDARRKQRQTLQVLPTGKTHALTPTLAVYFDAALHHRINIFTQEWELKKKWKTHATLLCIQRCRASAYMQRSTQTHTRTHACTCAHTHKKEKCGEISWLSAGVLPPVSTWWLGLAFQPWGIRRQRTQDCMFVCVYVCVCVGLRWGGGGAVLPEARSIIVSGLGVLFQPWSASVHGDLLTLARMLLKLFSQPKLWHTFQ